MITQSELKEILDYNPDTGIFKWLKKTCLKVVVGKIAGTVNSNGYILIAINKKLYRAHRLAWFYMKGVWPKNQIDHDDHVRHNNRWKNLFEATQRKNSKNQSKSKRNKSGVTGVFWIKKDRSWSATIFINNKHTHLLQSKDKFEAICARMSANNKYGFHENHGRK